MLVRAHSHRSNPHGIHIDGLELTPLGTSTPTNEPDDFFSTWDKEKPASKPSTPKPPSGPPSIGTRPAVPAATASASRTVTSSSLRAQPTSRPAAPAGSKLSSGPKAGKLGAKKAATSINFEEAQRKAIEEEERIKRLGYDKQREEEEARAVKEREAAERRARGEQISRSNTPLSSATNRNNVVDKPAVARLGFGQTVGQAAAAAPPKA